MLYADASTGWSPLAPPPESLHRRPHHPPRSQHYPSHRAADRHQVRVQSLLARRRCIRNASWISHDCSRTLAFYPRYERPATDRAPGGTFWRRSGTFRGGGHDRQTAGWVNWGQNKREGAECRHGQQSFIPHTVRRGTWATVVWKRRLFSFAQVAYSSVARRAVGE